MADPTLSNLDNLINMVNLGVIEGVNQATLELSGILASELPAGRAAKAIITKSAKRVGDEIIGSVAIEDQNVLQYLWAYWQGTPNPITINAKNQWMRFDNWSRGDNSYRWKSDGMFHFKSVQHTYPPHNFVERAIARFGNVASIISNKLGIRLK